MRRKIILETDGTEYSDNLTCAGNTWLRMSLDKDDLNYNLNIIVSGRLDTDSYTTTTLVGVSPDGIDSIITQLTDIRDSLVKDIKGI